MKTKRPVGFLNVDLEILSRSKLDAIESGMNGLAHALYCGPVGKKGIFLLSLGSEKESKNADAAILDLCAAVERLGKGERRLWEGALSRTFDVGYSLEPGARMVQVTLRPETVARVIALGATIAFSCYRELGSTSGSV